MLYFLFFILGLVVAWGIWVVMRKVAGTEDSSAAPQNDVRKESLIDKQAKEKAANLQKILDLLNTQNPLTNNQVQASLGISDATATRYLEELEKAGQIRQVGKTGKYVNYIKV